MTSQRSRPPQSIARKAVVGAGFGLCVAALTCGGKQAPLTATPALRSTALRREQGPPPPQAGLGFPGLAVPWTPPSLTAGDPAALGAALAEAGAVTLLLGPRLAGDAWAQRAAGLVAALSPHTRVLGHRQAALVELQGPGAEDRGELRTPGRSIGPEGRPRYGLPAGASTWLKGQESAVFGLDDAVVELEAWQALPAVSVGSCEPVMQALAAGQELALAQLGPFLDHADALLWSAYREQLRAFVPGFVAELAEYGQVRSRADSTDDESFARHACGVAYREQLRRYEKCGQAIAACPEAPRLVLVGGARIAAPESGVAAGEHCPALVGRDYQAEIRRLGQAAAEAASEALDREWTVLADRLGALTEVHAALEDICTPRRRRFAAADLEQARARLVRIGTALASDERDAGAGRWQLRDAALVVPGLGPSRELARFEAGAGSHNAEIVADARALREFVLSRSLCRSGHAATPIAAVVGAPGVGLRFLGYFYEEELFCGELPPLMQP
ncbi:MAG: hypothetical protein IPO88_24515 [Nannocystis sp.]|uniref:hypothetical protein n=1 Tax=Nannocystis sp. TaxID=1962667 RepID=UPI002429F297|nr:hypothetical protein [Nannocystis sp.]MBK9756605.1 hypothetical protein [Nannocystis sp.]